MKRRKKFGQGGKPPRMSLMTEAGFSKDDIRTWAYLLFLILRLNPYDAAFGSSKYHSHIWRKTLVLSLIRFRTIPCLWLAAHELDTECDWPQYQKNIVCFNGILLRIKISLDLSANWKFLQTITICCNCKFVLSYSKWIVCKASCTYSRMLTCTVQHM